jgi:Tfp pilus assembly protein PilZ
MSESDNRKTPRYPGEIPVAYTLGEVVASESAYLNNISVGGISFDSMVALDLGTVILLQIPVSHPLFTAPGRVIWCRKIAFQHQVGVEFLDTDADFRAHMVDMVRRIEAYRQDAARAGRDLSAQEATLEWIELFGGEFFHPR